MKQRERPMLVNLVLILLICALYFVTSEPDAASVMASVYDAPKYRGSANDAVAIQFAVSWNASALPDILDTLKEKGASVTFAVSGEWARGNPELLARMHEEGHEIATMGDSPEFDGKLSEVVEDIERSLAAIKAAGGGKAALYYSGSRNITVSSRAAKQLSLVHVLATVDLLCARGDSYDIIARALDEPIDGSIILMQPTSAAAGALPGLIEGLKMKGLGVVTTSDVLNGP